MIDTYPVTTNFWGEVEPDRSTILTGDHSVDVAVVGGGIAGMSSAYYLKKADPSLDVAIIERACLGHGASSRNFGNVSQLVRLAIPEFADQLDTVSVRFVVEHQARMLDEYEDFISAEGIECEFARIRCLDIAYDEHAGSELTTIAELHERYGYPSRLLDADETQSEIALPALAALSSSRNGYQHPFELTRGFRQAVLRAGVRVHEATRCTAIEEVRGRVRLHANNGSMTARRAVIATNADTPALGLGTDQIWPSYTYVLATEPLTEGQLSTLGLTGRHRLLLDRAPTEKHCYMQVRPDGCLLFGGGMVMAGPGSTKPPHDNLPAYRQLHAEMVRRFPSLADVRIVAAWGGPLDFTATGMPIWAKISDAVVLNAGYNARGALLGAMSGKVMVGLVLGPDYAFDDYVRFADFLGRVRSRWP
jgi:glycine/D-amino acid oxidase-like deaminating enzyme